MSLDLVTFYPTVIVSKPTTVCHIEAAPRFRNGLWLVYPRSPWVNPSEDPDSAYIHGSSLSVLITSSNTFLRIPRTQLHPNS